MSEAERGQVKASAAQIYEEFFVPALFQEWSQHIIKAANIRKGYKVLDVGCGTGILARNIAESIGTSNVTGIDVNEGMLAVAKSVAPEIEWRHGQAESLPFEDDSFDAVVCQFGLMFFENRQLAIREMLRVVRPNHKAAIAVWASLDDTPGYAAMVDILQRLFGEEAANGLRAPYNMGDTKIIDTLLDNAGISDYSIHTIEGTARFPSIAAWVFTDIKGWVLADSIDEVQYQQLLTTAEQELQSFTNADSQVSFSAPAHIISITK